MKQEALLLISSLVLTTGAYAMPADLHDSPEQPLARITATNSLQWLKADNGQVSANAIIAADNANNSKVIICQAKDHGEVYPGQVHAGKCVVTFSGKSYTHNAYTVLAGSAKVSWKDKDSPYILDYRYASSNNRMYGALPQNSESNINLLLPVIGGFSQAHPFYKHPLYICRAMVGQGIKVGKIVVGKCNVADGDKEIVVASYQQLFTEIKPG